ncbi:MAG: acyl-CoA thioesterase [Betaproteobacteria bacterium]|nr:acyl-CoA thioesterase [Betaproteobacteria bacterium]
MTKPTPNPRTHYRHYSTITTRWMDNDVYRHVNNVVFYSFFDTAVNQYLMQQGVLDLDRSPVVSLVVETGCQFFSPIAFPDIVHCGLRVAHLGNSSVRYEIGIFRNGEPQAAAQGHFVHVACDRATHRPVAMPADLRRALQALR